jgi:hypothetical protein
MLLSLNEKSLTVADPTIKASPAHTKKIELSDLEKSPPVKLGALIVWATPFLDELSGGFGLSLGFSDQSRLILRPLPVEVNNGEPDNLPPIADWELFTPFGRYLQAGPGRQWAYLPTADEGKPVPSGAPTMADDDLGISTNITMLFAFPRDDGKWTKRPGSVSFVDGHFHKIIVPGLETRSGQSFGITATFHVIQDLSADDPQRGNVARFVVQNGRLMSTDVVASGVELVD